MTCGVNKMLRASSQEVNNDVVCCGAPELYSQIIEWYL